MSTTSVNPYEISMEELKNLAAGVPLPPPEQPRDEQGRFVSADEGQPTVDESVETQTEETEPEQFIAEREIDLEDGSGVQVFRGVGDTQEAAWEALADELAKAQANATKKIRELSAKPAAPPAPEKPAISAEDAFLASQGDVEATQRIIDARVEAKLKEANEARQRQEAEARERDRQEDIIASQFIADNPDYFVSPQNGRRLVRQLEIEGLPRTRESLNKVYADLKADGLITQKPAEQPPVTPRPRSSGLSTRGSVAPPPANVSKDPRKMSLEELREAAGGYQNPYAR